MVRQGGTLILVAALASAPIVAAPGPLSTLTLGRYVCERPAEPGSQVAVTDPATSFAVTTASRYVAADGTRGTYLLTGDTMEMTSGPLAGTRLVRLRGSFLRVLGADGLPGPTRCVLSRNSDKH
jgi:hypothetical protein